MASNNRVGTVRLLVSLTLGVVCLWSLQYGEFPPGVFILPPGVNKLVHMLPRRRVIMFEGRDVQVSAVETEQQADMLDGKKRRVAPMSLPFGDVSFDYCMMKFSQFVPRLYNLCKSLGFKKGKILPSIGFCSDENQGYPTLMITKHFGAYPFNHGYIGGIMALDRHGPHAAHADDVVLIHAPHVGFDPGSQVYGTYRRRQIEAGPESGELQMSGTCGKMVGLMKPYIQAYDELLGRIRARVEGDHVVISLSRELLPSQDPREDGIFLKFDKLLAKGALDDPVLRRSVTCVFPASDSFADEFIDLMRTEDFWDREFDWHSLQDPKLSHLLKEDMFGFTKKRESLAGEEHRLERALLPNLPKVLTSPHDDELSAALICMQSEFDRSVHSVAAEPSYKGKNLILITGLNIDISPAQDLQEAFPATLFLPWSAYVQLRDGSHRVIQQLDLVADLCAQSTENPDAIDLEQSITELFVRKRRRITFFDARTATKKSAQVL
eukprot:TRINITY_DN1550_c0_g1_i1.p1 TRINITY_DN1550_c0_g1~~TRINITY_DN1550_c0_g1_i1.p1  ORF type:complete len:494 (-),score=68.91 TRINITY_DN1550_c0_g1_i1:373-1854(-)